MIEKNTSQKSNQQKATEAIRLKITNEINNSTHIASQCDYWDLLRLYYELKLNRICMASAGHQKKSQGDIIGFHLNDDALKYVISLVAKHGKWREVESMTCLSPSFDLSRTHKLQEHARRINSMFEIESILAISNIQIIGGEGKKYLIDLASCLDTPEYKLCLNYGLRIERYAKSGKENTISPDALVEKISSKYSDISDLFESENKISLTSYCEGLKKTKEILEERMKAAEDMLTEDSGKIDPFTPRSFVAITRMMVFTESELKANFSNEFISYIYNHAFEADVFKDDELRYHYITRRPFLIGNGFVLISPELVFDSLLDNNHYSFLESNRAKDIYKEKYSAQFIDEVVAVANKAGYQEINRDFWLNENGKAIGDIDLILKHSITGHEILVECKNHSLPLTVYHRSPNEIHRHIKNTSDWERKVKRRIQHLKGPNPGYNVGEDWDYVIVTQMPEPLSHVSSLLVMTTREFDFWLNLSSKPKNFDYLNQQIDEAEPIHFSPSDIINFKRAGFTTFD